MLTEPAASRPAASPALLYGTAAIAAYIGTTVDATEHLIRKRVLPVFRIGRTVVARPARIDQALAHLERLQQAGG